MKMFKKKHKEKSGCIGHYDIKPYHYFESNLIYAKDVLIKNSDGVKVYSRLYKSCLFLLVLIEDETYFSFEKYNYEALKSEVDSLIEGKHNTRVSLYIFKNNNEKTIEFAKVKTINTKKEFNQAFIYNAKDVTLDYYRPVPSFYKIYDDYLEAIYFDLAAIDSTR